MTSRKLLLVEPPFYRLIKSTYALLRYPLSLGYLASAVKMNTDWSVLAYNADFSPVTDPFHMGYLTGEGFLRYLRELKDPSGSIWQEVRECIAGYAPSVVGISAKSSTFASAAIVAGIAKEINPQTLVIMGGPHPSAVGMKVLDCPQIDMAVMGEGEATLVELLCALDSGQETFEVRGLVCRGGKSRPAAARREPIIDLDGLGFPVLPAPEVLKDYGRYPPEAFRSVLATRGCPNNCFFCGSRDLWGRRVRFRSPQNVVREIRTLQARGVHRIHFEDDTFGVHASYLRALCEEITTECPGIQWSCETHVNLASDENLAFMKASGCVCIQLGIESGNNRILREIRKGYTIEEALEACERVRKCGIELETFFMLGFPQETEETLRDTLKAIETVDCRKVIYSIFTPYPGTEAFEFCNTQGLIPVGYDPLLHHHQSPENHFCANIPPVRFRHLASQVEQAVDEKNRRQRERS